MNAHAIDGMRQYDADFNDRQKSRNNCVHTLNIGAKVRQLRLDNKLTLKNVSQKIGLSTSLISQIENNNVSPPIATLSKIASFFEVKISIFFTENEGDSRFEVVHANRREAIAKLVNPVGAAIGCSCESLSLRLNHKKMEPFLLTIRDKTIGATRINHEGEIFLHVIKGNLNLFVDKQCITLAIGDSIYFDSSIQHQIAATDDTDVEVVAVIAR